MPQVITVGPLPGGWSVQSDAETLVFSSGAKAERCARQIGFALADAGETAEIRIITRDGKLGGRFLCQPGSS